MKKGSFQRKLFFTYSIFTVAVALLVLTAFYKYNEWLFRDNSMQSLSQLVQLHSDKLDSMVQEMDGISIDILSDDEILDALEHRESDGMVASSVNNHLLYLINQYTLNRSIFNGMIHKVRIFTDDGFFISNDRSRDLDANSGKKVGQITWLEEVRGAGGGKVLLPLRENEWTRDSTVFSLARTISTPYQQLGYVEIQQDANVLLDICSFGKDGVQTVFLIGDGGKLIYGGSDLDLELLPQYGALAAGDSGVAQFNNPVRNRLENVYYQRSSYTGLTMVCVEDAAYIGQSFGLIRGTIVFSGVLLIVLTLMLSYFFSYRLVKPLKKLELEMEHTNLENLPDSSSQDSAYKDFNEIEMVSVSFQNMKARLDKAITAEVNYRALQTEARFSVLQAQINPHFLYNMLNVMVNTAEEKNVPELSDICRRMARCLRYSTTGAGAMATLRDELAHTQDYLILMKTRYEDGLSYTVEADPRLEQISVPKLVVQPLVENALSHGFNDRAGVKRIAVIGEIKDGRWFLRVLDNGSGFGQEQLLSLKERVQGYLAEISDGKTPEEIPIGGMGLMNTMARLRYYFGDAFSFEISNRPEGGACIVLSGAYERGPDNGNTDPAGG